MEKVAKEKNSLIILKIFEVLSQIGKVLCIIGAVCMLMLAILIPVSTKYISLGNGELKVFNEKLNYYVKDGGIELKASNGFTYEIEKGDLEKISKDFEAADIVEWIDNISLKNILVFIELSVIMVIGIIVLTVFIISKYIKIIKRTRENKSPFDEETAIDFRMLTNYYLIGFIFNIVFGTIITIVTKIDANVQIVNNYLIYAGITYIVSWCITMGIPTKKKSKKIEE